MIKQELAKEYVQRIHKVIDECKEQEREAYKDKKDMNVAYRHSDHRIDRVLDNYFAKLRIA